MYNTQTAHSPLPVPQSHTLQDAWQKLGHRVSEGAVLLRERVPQNDLLGSGRLAAFVTQGGYLSMQVGPLA